MPGVPFGPSPRSDDDLAFADLAALDAVDRLERGLEHHRGPAQLQIALLGDAEFDDAGFRREAAAQHDDRRMRAERPRDRTDGLFVRDLEAGEVLSQRLACHGPGTGLHEALELLHDAPRAASRLERFDGGAPFGRTAVNSGIMSANARTS